MLKVNHKDTRTYFTSFSSVSIVGFKQVNVRWVCLIMCTENKQMNQIVNKKRICRKCCRKCRICRKCCDFFFQQKRKNVKIFHKLSKALNVNAVISYGATRSVRSVTTKKYSKVIVVKMNFKFFIWSYL